VADRPPAVVPDTSVVLKWFLHEQEPGRERALALRRAYLEGRARLLVPDLLFYEVANVLRCKPDWDARRAARAVAALFALQMEIVSVSPPLLQQAIALACERDLAIYDAAFVILAANAGADFITADEQLARRLEPLPYVHRLVSGLDHGGRPHREEMTR